MPFGSAEEAPHILAWSAQEACCVGLRRWWHWAHRTGSHKGWEPGLAEAVKNFAHRSKVLLWMICKMQTNPVVGVNDFAWDHLPWNALWQSPVHWGQSVLWLDTVHSFREAFIWSSWRSWRSHMELIGISTWKNSKLTAGKRQQVHQMIEDLEGMNPSHLDWANLLCAGCCCGCAFSSDGVDAPYVWSLFGSGSRHEAYQQNAPSYASPWCFWLCKTKQRQNQSSTH